MLQEGSGFCPKLTKRLKRWVTHVEWFLLDPMQILNRGDDEVDEDDDDNDKVCSLLAQKMC